ncbi:MAG: family lipase [Herbinix sp.]|jgi:lysophospholipase L1-like esterase|nr:family lipase [Herbinix sp.]
MKSKTIKIIIAIVFLLLLGGNIIMANLLLTTDTLAEGKDKINAIIQDAEEAVATAESASVKSQTALDAANAALANSESTQTQLNQIVIDGDSSVEAAQARVDASGFAYGVLKERLDTEYAKVNSQLADFVTKKRTFHANRTINKLKNGEAVTIVFLGDSITDDFYVANGHVAQLETWLNGLYPGLVTVINAGVGGNNIKQMWDRLYSSVLINNPDLIIVSSGTNDNDGGAAISTSLFRQYYGELIKEILSTNDIDVILRSSTPLMDESRNIVLESFNKITEETARKYNLGFYDVYSMFESSFADGSIVQADINLDGTHLNELGQTYIAEWFKPYFVPTDFIETPSSLYNMLNGLDGFKVYNTGAVQTTSPSTIGGKFFYFNSPNNYVSTEFDGEEVTIVYTSGAALGQFVAEIDGVSQTLVDTYNPSTVFRNSITYKLTPGKHTLKIINQSTKNASSSNTLLHIQAIIYKNTQSFPDKNIPIFVDFAWVYQSVEQTLTSGSPYLLITNSRVDDTKLLTVSSGTFTFAKSGVYDILFTMKVIATENADIVVRLEVNGSMNKKYVYDKISSAIGTQSKTVDLHDILSLNKDDYIRVYITVGGVTPKITPSLKVVKL